MAETEKGKLICKVGAVALLMEKYKEQIVFKVAIVDATDNIIASGTIDSAAAVFLERCLGAAISEAFSANLKNLWDEEGQEG